MSKERADITVIKTEILPYEPKKMDFGRMPVCSLCGNGLHQWPEHKGVPCCEDGERITLRKYHEDVLKKEFNNEGWSFEEKTIYAGSDEFVKKMSEKHSTEDKEDE